jgi:mRNA-degrading endonuclease HigB of HigAB toxin-antitoxin module
MRITKESRIAEFIQNHPAARASLENWLDKTRASHWQSFRDLRQTFRDADQVVLECVDPSTNAKIFRSVVIFNIAHNKFRLIAAIHYRWKNTGILLERVFVLKFMTHPEYDRSLWKEELCLG